MPRDEAFDLETLEFHAVRTLLLDRLESPLGRTAVAALVPLPDLASAQLRLRAVAVMADRLRAGQSLPLGGAVEVRSWLSGFVAGEHSLQARDVADLKRGLRAADATN